MPINMINIDKKKIGISQGARDSNVTNPSEVFFSVDFTISECTFKATSTPPNKQFCIPIKID